MCDKKRKTHSFYKSGILLLRRELLLLGVFPSPDEPVDNLFYSTKSSVPTTKNTDPTARRVPFRSVSGGRGKAENMK